MIKFAGVVARAAFAVLLAGFFAGTSFAGGDTQGDAPCPVVPPVVKPEQKPVVDDYHLIPPLVWGCEDEWKLQFGGSVSFRNEYRRNYDMYSGINDNDHLSFMRTYLNTDVVYRGVFRVFLEVLTADVYNNNTDVRQQDSWDLAQLFVELKDTPDSPWTLRIGRQRLPIVSEGRVWGLPPIEYYWFNLLPTFNGAMVDYKTKDTTVHAFLLQPQSYAENFHGTLSTGNLWGLDRTWHYGVYSQFKQCAPHTFDFYWLGLSDANDNRTYPAAGWDEYKNYGTSNRQTVGAMARGPIAKFDGCGTLGYGIEGAYQFGRQSSDDIDAYMVHADVNYVWDHPWKPKLTLLGNIATGDKKLGDGENNTFSPLYGSSHYGYGTIDFFRLSNMRELAATYQMEPCDKLKLLLEYHHFWLDSRTAPWNTALGTTYGAFPEGNAGRDAGDEIDFTATYKVNKNMQCEAGAAYFFPGRWPEKQGRDSSATFLFLQTVFKF
jgi:hypothetical protein